MTELNSHIKKIIRYLLDDETQGALSFAAIEYADHVRENQELVTQLVGIIGESDLTKITDYCYFHGYFDTEE